MTLIPMVLRVCESCREGAGGECHEPGCAFWMNRAPDIPLAATGREELIEAGAAVYPDAISPRGVAENYEP